MDRLLREQPGHFLEAWVFEDEPTRRSTEATLAAAGIAARLRSAYKPLLHFFLEEVELTGLSAATIRTPSHALASPGRFELEAYPLAGLLPGAALRFEPGSDELHYHVILEHGTRRAEHLVLAPNRERCNPFGDPVLASCGWLRSDPATIGSPLDTEYEAAFAAVMDLVVKGEWPASPPFFDTFAIDIETGGIEHRLPYGDECVSTREALHEDLYFSVLEFFQHRAGLPPGDRTLRLGQVLPDIRRGCGPTRVRVAAGKLDRPAEFRDGDQVLDEAVRPLDPAQVASELDALGGERFDVASHQGRPVLAAQVAGKGIGLVISAGQHANETSGVVGALRAARVLKQRGLGFALIPQENPDGYALHRALRAANPRHMHHAARFTALGDDLAFRTDEPFIEVEARRDAYRRVDAVLHVNLHGYPAHEWTRPHTGYVPRDSRQWAIPKGFFFILSHKAGLRAEADAFVRALSAQVSRTPGLRAFNEAQISVFEAHAGPLAFPVHDAIVCIVKESPGQIPPFMLTTEYPDETIYGDAFRFAHTVQMEAVIEAANLLAEGVLPP
ncbi:MAG TPA: peptidase M14 [Roseomonas sp.]